MTQRSDTDKRPREYYSAEAIGMDFNTRRYRDGWEFSPTKHVWLARLAWKLLMRLHAMKPAWRTEKVYKFVEPVDHPEINAAIGALLKGKHRMGANPANYVIVMGSSTFRELLGQSDAPIMPMNRTDVEFRAGPFFYEGGRFFQPYHLVDDIKGVALIPRVLVERKVESRL